MFTDADEVGMHRTKRTRDAVRATAHTEIRSILSSCSQMKPSDGLTSALLNDVRWWVELGLARPSSCVLSYPAELLSEAFGSVDAVRARFGEINCKTALLSGRVETLPEHLCVQTAKESVRHHARRHHPPRTPAGRAWVAQWPLPAGSEAISHFAANRGLPRSDLPRSIISGDRMAHVTLWVQQRVMETIPRSDRSAWTAETQTCVVLQGGARWCHKAGLTWANGWGTPRTRIEFDGSHVDARDRAVLDTAYEQLRRLADWYERVVMPLPGLRGGQRRKEAVRLRAARHLLQRERDVLTGTRQGLDAVACQVADALHDEGLEISSSTVLGWLRTDQLRAGR